ncbi:MAG TPA: Rieske 2Fe-2S domain-containing protein [Anaerolineae bacterium]|nr:Rieske 2Fe-2S domain-containing protein [Anaerolineae bacterium]
MSTTPPTNIASKQGAEDAGKYFRYMADFVGFKPEDAQVIRQTRPVIEQHLPEIVSKFYAHLLRYPPTRQWFLKPDGTIDQDYLELRMRHLTNFWVRTAEANFDDEYARYVDYVGRAHTSHGADPKIYIAERYVIGQVGFMSHAISNVIMKELHPVDPDFAFRAEEAWDNLMMVLLEMLSRAYGAERVAETFEAMQPVDIESVQKMALAAFDIEQGEVKAIALKQVAVAQAADILDGERKIVTVDGRSIGVFHHNGQWYALRNSCLHRGGPVCTGSLEGDTLTCPWHGFQYDIKTGEFLSDRSACLDSYAVLIDNGSVVLEVPDAQATIQSPPPALARTLKDNEFLVDAVPPGTVTLVGNVAVFNVGGTFHATQNECTHKLGPLNEGLLDGRIIECPWHGSKFDVCTGQVILGPAKQPLKTYRVIVDGPIGRVEEHSAISTEAGAMEDNEFAVSDVPPGSALLVGTVAVFNVDGTIYATADECTHKQGPLSDGELDGEVVTCPYHGAQFNVCTGKVLRGPAEKDVQTYRVAIDGAIGRVENA